MSNDEKNDFYFMARALILAQRGLYTTDPNPRVGCVLVKNGEIIGEGWHERAGQAHAEVYALNHATQSVEGATAYVTLEPCSHHGRTPPCCDALIAAGISRLVVAMRDPNPLVAGQGLARCREAGMDVVCDVLKEQAQTLNEGFISRMTRKRPFVRSKIAMSLDGRTALANGESQWITSAPSREDVHRFRAQSSAILTAIGTVLIDNPTLNARVDFPLVQPVRVVLDSQLKLMPNAKMRDIDGPIWVLTCSDNVANKATLERAGFEVYVLPDYQGRLDLHAVMAFLAQKEINNVFVEAGASLNGALLEANLVDEWLIYMAPCVLGDKGRGIFVLPELTSMKNKSHFHWQNVRHIGQDLRLTLSRKNSVVA